MGGGNERLRHEHSLRTAATRSCDDGWLPSAKHSRGCRNELQKRVSATPWACGRRGRGGKVANMDAKIPVRANTKRCGCEIIRAGHRPLASICPMVPYTLHEWTEAPYGCDIGIPSDRGNAWMKQLMAAVGPEANRQRGLRPVMKTQILRLRHSRSTRGASASLLTCPIAILLWNGLWPLLPPHSLGLWPTMYAESLSCVAWKTCLGQATTIAGTRAGRRR